MKQLISRQDLAGAMISNRIPMPGMAEPLMHLLKLNKLNKHYGEVSHLQGIAFIDGVLETLGITADFSEQDVSHIPRSGPFIVVSNHPYGGIDGLILLKLLLTVRPDTKLLANFLLQGIPNVSDFLIAVSPFDELGHHASISGIRCALRHVEKGMPLAIFPAGEVSAFNWETKCIADRAWHPVVGRLITKAAVPVLSVFFDGNNGRLFNLLGLLNPMMRTARLPAELFNKSGRRISVRIGRLIPFNQLPVADGQSDRLLAYLRTRTYALGLGKDLPKKWWAPERVFHVPKKPKTLISPIDPEVLESEIGSIDSLRMLTQSVYSVYIAPAHRIPNTLKEIGRLREETFRAVGEGTNKAIDLDVFDIYYQHLFIWDTEARCVVGAYRLGKGEELYEMIGKRGFYLSQLFKMKKPFEAILQNALELGRSWVRVAYQQQPLPLYLLWKGVAAYLQEHPQYRYLIGPVSISNDFSAFSKSMFTVYIQENHFDREMAELVKPRRAFRINHPNVDPRTLLPDKKSLKELEKLIADFEPKNARMPVLLRQYLKLNAKIIAFNVDPKFANCLDGLLVLDIKNVPPDVWRRYTR